jgi:hypothetical protein
MIRFRLIVLAVLSAALSACLLIPGKFDSALDLRRDGTFHFHYAGQLVFLPLTDAARSTMAKGLQKLQAKPAAPAGEQTQVFTEQTCTVPGSGEARACTADEIAAQHRAWDMRNKAPAPAPSTDAGAGAMLAMMGGINASDPDAPNQMAAALRRQAGWHKVEYRGNGVFDVDFDVAGRLDHDFTFPTLEHSPLIMPLVSVIRRADGTVRVEAPGFAPGLGSMAALGAAIPGGANKAQNPLQGLPVIDGMFAVTTDGAILANNTEDGPAAAGGAQRLSWHVAAGRAAAPTALIRVN